MRITLLRFSLPILIATVALAAAIAAGGIALSNQNVAPSGTVEVTATGSATVGPDTLTVDFTVTTKSKSSRAAVSKNNAQSHALEASLMNSGVLAKNLQTSNFSVTQGFNAQGNHNGYVAENDLTATLHNLKNAGQTIDAAQASVGNDVSVNETTYSISDSSKLESKARINAMRNAIKSADDFATGGNETLGRIIKISEQENNPSPVFFNFKSAVPGATSKSPTSVPLQRGTQTVTVQVDVIFTLN